MTFKVGKGGTELDALRCIPSQYIGVMLLINCRNKDSILVLISTILRPPSANVFNSDFLFKASGLLFRNGKANF